MPVLGVGGVFLRSRHPDELGTWYRTHLGVGPGLAAPSAGEADEWSWRTQGGPLVFAPFPDATVTRSNPEAGASVPRGSTVTLVLALFG